MEDFTENGHLENAHINRYSKTIHENFNLKSKNYRIPLIVKH